MKTEKALTPPSPPLSGGESTAQKESGLTPSLDKGRVGEGLNHPKHLPYNPNLTTRARTNRKNPTPAETTIWQKLLRNRQFHGYKFLRQKPIGPYIADFYCAELKLVVEIDGDSHAEQEAYDAERSAYLARQGICVLRYTNIDVSQQLEGIHDDLSNHLERTTS